ncbi:hypothetical protein SAMN04488498_11980 [Mesorhizobium albiziae]|uniref:Uncharacterized protein n=1 Tax=Neomesorhizobium albiziae TaxID=335020 RepID=A0A1I4DTZ3_9HYPH|nr:hypothetical protein [Mesorhizobium albiziae]GLS33755.1 hypothetical protein GCM10007937_54670 [Mesorhizobium albiziae]SFK96399.1 hypothetical protein SAMN04488498_11980 [Mesorhizobium albiziae]
MTDPQIIYVENANLYVLLVGNKIAQIQKCTVSRINPHAKHVDCLDVALDRTRVVEREPYFGSKSALCLDAADLTTFAAWLRDEIMPRASIKAFGKAMERMFSGSMHFRDVAAAAGRAAGVPGMKRAQGEELFYMDRAKASDPEGFAEMAAKYDPNGL